MSWFIWSVVAWALMSLPLGIAMGRAMTRANPASDSSDAADWQQIREELTGIMPGSGTAVAWAEPSSETSLSKTAVGARKVA
jgi:hypothetical protein